MRADRRVEESQKGSFALFPVSRIAWVTTEQQPEPKGADTASVALLSKKPMWQVLPACPAWQETICLPFCRKNQSCRFVQSAGRLFRFRHLQFLYEVNNHIGCFLVFLFQRDEAGHMFRHIREACVELAASTAYCFGIEADYFPFLTCAMLLKKHPFTFSAGASGWSEYQIRWEVRPAARKLPDNCL